MLLPETASPIFWVVLFSCWGWTAEATESAAPLMASPACSRYDFCESGLAAEVSWQVSVLLQVVDIWEGRRCGLVAQAASCGYSPCHRVPGGQCQTLLISCWWWWW